jgi:hypothetical protein
MDELKRRYPLANFQGNLTELVEQIVRSSQLSDHAKDQFGVLIEDELIESKVRDMLDGALDGVFAMLHMGGGCLWRWAESELVSFAEESIAGSTAEDGMPDEAFMFERAELLGMVIVEMLASAYRSEGTAAQLQLLRSAVAREARAGLAMSAQEEESSAAPSAEEGCSTIH